MLYFIYKFITIMVFTIKYEIPTIAWNFEVIKLKSSNGKTCFVLITYNTIIHSIILTYL